jgi:hypothetical protein
MKAGSGLAAILMQVCASVRLGWSIDRAGVRLVIKGVTQWRGKKVMSRACHQISTSTLFFEKSDVKGS